MYGEAIKEKDNMKVSDLIARKDMSSILYKVTGENADWKDCWDVELFSQAKGVMKAGMIDKDDDMWKVVASIVEEYETISVKGE